MSQKFDRFSELYKAQNDAAAKKRPLSGNVKSLAIQKFDELDKMMLQNIQELKDEVMNLKIDNYKTGAHTLRHLESRSFLKSRDMPIRVLDSIIEHEVKAKPQRCEIYNRGQNLK